MSFLLGLLQSWIFTRARRFCPVIPLPAKNRPRISRAPISLDRLSYDGPNGTVDYRPKFSPGHPPFGDDASHQHPLDVLAANTNHIPNTGRQLVCYLSWCSDKIRSRCQFPVIAETDA